MPDDLVARLNAFTANKHPGHVGVSLTHCEATRVEGRLTVTEPVVAGTGFLWAPVVITLADWLCAAGMSPNLKEGESFTTVELKTNFPRQRQGRRGRLRRRNPRAPGPHHACLGCRSQKREQRKGDRPVPLYPDDPRAALARVGREPGSRSLGNRALMLAVVEIPAHGALHQHGKGHGEGSLDQSVHGTSP
jgi:acyl-coenzyme A thioesterase PaaI-like protein